MKIKYKLYGGSVTSTILISIIIFAVFVTSNKVEEENRNRDFANNVLKGISELGTLTNEYLLYYEKGVEERWSLKYNTISKDLIQIEKEKVGSIRSHYISLGDLFLQVTRNVKRTQNLNKQNAPQEDIDSAVTFEEKLRTQLSLKTQSIISDALIFSAKANSEANKTQKLANNLILILIILIAIIVIVSSFLIARSISKPLAKLTKDIEIIGTGRINHRIDIKSKDEIGILGTAFKQMLENLNKSTIGVKELENQVSEKTKEIQSRVDELERYFKFTIGRELKMTELKKQVKKLEGKK